MSPAKDIVTGRSAMQIGAALTAGLIEADALVEQTLAGIAACEDQAIFTRLTPERARREAAAATLRRRAGRSRGLLDGVPIAWKDLFDLEGLVTTAGSRCFDQEPPAARDAPVVARLREAGMVCLGRVNMTELAYSGIGLNPHFGTPRNPHGTGYARAPGGSSSGSGVAVARGLVPAAIGSDTGGSVRIPAAFNGIVGYKASGGRYPMEGVYPLAATLDTLGVLCRTTEDAILIDAAMRGLVAPNLCHVAIEGLRIIVPQNVVLDDCEPAVLANFEAAIDRLAEAGATIERANLPAFDEIMALGARHGTIVAAEAYALHKERIEGPAGTQIDRRVASRIARGASVSARDYICILQARRRLIGEVAAAMQGRCLVAFPTIAHTAPSIAALEADDELFTRVNMKTLRNTMFGNFLDWCGVSIPTGVDAAGLPTALLLSGAPGGDDHLLASSLAAEPWVRGEAA